jgi:glycosyltransferase involved in cell wall biosynthesis
MTTDVLMVTYNRPAYTRLSLPRLLETADGDTRVWLWHNGDDAETLEVVRAHADHPRVHEFHHSQKNVDLREPTNWLWSNARGEFFGKVDDDILVPAGWIQALRAAHDAEPRFGPISCWHYFPEDFVPELGRRRLQTHNGVTIMRNCWVGGTGYLMKRDCVDSRGPLAPGQGWTNYCLRLSLDCWILGWLHPFLLQDHMDDPRSPNAGVRTDADLAERMPRMARTYGVQSVDDWIAWLRMDARAIQASPLDPRAFSGWRRKVRSLRRRLDALTGGGAAA